jgi:hypothetical protein
MSEKIAFIDTLRIVYENSPQEKKEEMKKQMKTALEKSFRSDLDAKVDRWLEPPSVGIIDVTNTNFISIFMESSLCYVFGLFYSTISVCGITAERLCMDILSRHTITLDGRILTLNELTSLFSIPHRNMIELLNVWKLINDDTRKKLHVINDIRNKYIHPDVIPDLELASGKGVLKKDALEILTTLKAVLSQSFPRDMTTPVNLESKKLEDIGKK